MVTYTRETTATQALEIQAREDAEFIRLLNAATAANATTDGSTTVQTNRYVEQRLGVEWLEMNNSVPTWYPVTGTGTYYRVSNPTYLGSYTATSDLFSIPFVPQRSVFPQPELRKRNIEHTLATLRQYDLVDQDVPLFVVKNTERYTSSQCVATEAMLLKGMSISVSSFNHPDAGPESLYCCLYCSTAQLRNTILAHRALHDYNSNEYWFSLNPSNSYDASSLTDLRTFLRSL